MSDKKGFMFSVVLTVSDNPGYLEQSISSVLDQTLDFKDNVQIIFIDYGGCVESTELIRRVGRVYPDNVVILSKDYLGQPYAENNVYKVPGGEYVTFLEGTDYFSKNTFEQVKNFYDKHSEESNIVSIPVINGNTEDRLNYKFEQTRIINLEEEANNPQLHLKSCFIKKSALHNYKYNRKTLFEEETILINQLLLDLPRIGVIKNVKYYIRQIFDPKLFKNKTIQEKKYIQRIIFIKKLLSTSITKKSIVPDFIKYTITYYIQNILKLPDLSFLDKEGKNQLLGEVQSIISILDDDMIYDNENIDYALKGFFIYLKKGVYSIVGEDDNVVMRSGDYYIDDLKKHRIWLDIVDINDNQLIISGVYTTNFDNDSLRINLIKEDAGNNRETFSCDYFTYPQRDRSNVEYLGIPWKFVYNFEVSLKLKDVIHNKYTFEVTFEENNIQMKYTPRIEFRISSYFSSVSIYAVIGEYILFKDSSSISVIPYSFRKLFNFEVKNIFKIIKSSEKGKVGAAFMHFLYLLLYKLMDNKKIWLLNDRLDMVDDNAKHLFEYALKQDDGINKYLIVDKNSEDYKKLKKNYKNIITYGSFKHKILYLFSEKRISSLLNEKFFNPFYNDEEDKRKLYCNLVTAPRYFIQHGVIYRNLTEHIKRYNHNLRLIVTSAEREKQSFFDLNYRFPEEVVQILGLPRFDNLIRDNKIKKQILFTPTWRLQLDKNESLFLNSDYYHMLNSFLSNGELFELLDEYGYKFIFKPHPQLIKHLDSFEMNEAVVVSTGESYQELIRGSALMISDVSSVISDFAYLKKPIIYYQKNEDHHFEPFFDYVSEGFGDVLKSEDDVICKLRFYLENGCVMEDKYKERVSNFFKYNDKDNCKRVYEWILKH
ncbi:CDP-glycerol glycerophosphotransferase family protein [Methanosphaera sp. ISO3-F5]|uniref:bifunctional glycosyltransferase/CDP-glycerol:glycerophosphate glycerophosphotransferase n=1 Tax=Methanosphaera sp. ISO3-F5 TaxID=1452353 RepID=UPI002B262F73|nr:CDP-glycerol glycerophosphotransferase family protein [Methanosphaera sp. ISO3-F5]WQH63476.1 CDP-glycerol glycerophosphotransferase family protein [Methanosphaera sp. ISO3-F5]